MPVNFLLFNLRVRIVLVSTWYRLYGETKTDAAIGGGTGQGTWRFELEDIDWDDNDLELPDSKRFEDYTMSQPKLGQFESG
jgi:hypothetical protein